MVLSPQKPLYHRRDLTDKTTIQAATAIDSLKMSDSPAKKIDFTVENKENVDYGVEKAVPIKGIPELDDLPEEPTKPSVAPTIHDDEAVEPLLQENAQRFVLFPIKYHEVSRRCGRALDA